MKLSTVAEQMKAAQEAAQEMFQPEELDPELAEYYTESEPFPMIRHPLVYSIMHAPMLNKRMNLMLKHKKERIAELEAAGEFDSILGYYERPYRLDALLIYRDRMTDQQYWNSLGWIWTDTENFWQNADLWQEVMTADRPGREGLMDQDDRTLYESLPDTVTVYRGQSPEHELGMSWTTDKAKAEWFATRFKAAGVVFAGTVRKQDVIACFAGRGESEVVVLPGDVQLIAQNA